MKFPLLLDLAADGIPVAVACRVLGSSKQAFYVWKAAPVTTRDWSDAHLINAAIDVHWDDLAFGYRFIADELEDQGFSAGENRVARLCSSQRIWSVFAKKRGLTRKAGPPVHDDHVHRDFTATALIICGSRTSLKTGPTRASSTCAPSKTSTPTGSWATPSIPG